MALCPSRTVTKHHPRDGYAIAGNGAIAPVTPRRTQLAGSTDARPAGSESIQPTHSHSATNASQERSDSPVLDLGYTAHTPADDAWLCPSHARNSARHSKLTHSRSIAAAITVGHSGGSGRGEVFRGRDEV